MIQVLNQIKRKIVLLLQRATVKGREIGSLDVLKLNNISKAQAINLQQYGFNSAVPLNSEAIVAFVGGHSSAGVVIATDSILYRTGDLEDGEVEIYSKFGSKIKLDNLGNVEISGTNINLKASASLKLTAPAINFSRI